MFRKDKNKKRINNILEVPTVKKSLKKCNSMTINFIIDSVERQTRCWTYNSKLVAPERGGKGWHWSNISRPSTKTKSVGKVAQDKQDTRANKSVEEERANADV